jgi:biotin carboxyl carrier protein
MDLRKLKTLIDLVSESNISELEITEAEGKVRIVKAGPCARCTGAYAPAPVAASGTVAGTAAEQAAAAAAPATRRDRGQDHQVADGRHLLPRRQPGRQAVRRRGPAWSRKVSRSASSRR